MIPRRIHIIWLNRDRADDTIPAPYDQFIEGWREKHPDWDVQVHRTRDIAERCPLLGQSLLEKLARGVHPAMVSDLMRVELVHRTGGFYLDADIECVRNLEPLRDCETLLAKENPTSKAVASGVFADEPQGAFTTLLLEDIQANQGNLLGGSIKSWTRAKDRLLAAFPQRVTRILEPPAFFPFYSVYVPKELKLSADCFGIHWYAATWMGAGSKHHLSFRAAIERLRGVRLK